MASQRVAELRGIADSEVRICDFVLMRQMSFGYSKSVVLFFREFPFGMDVMVANVLCIKWGTRYGCEYVNRLYHGVRQHLAGDVRFICLTEDPSGIDANVEILPLPVTPFDEAAFDAKRGGETWRKIGLFQPELAGLEGDALFLDLDVVITGPMNEMFNYHPGKFVVIQDWLEKRRAAWIPGRNGRVGNTSVFRFNLKDHSKVYTTFAADQRRSLDSFRIEQQFVSHVLRDCTEFWPSQWIQSFKRSCRPMFPLNLLTPPAEPVGCRVLVFHGRPFPDQAITGYDGGMFHSTLPARWLETHWMAYDRSRAA